MDRPDGCIDPADLKRLERYLRRKVGCVSLSLNMPAHSVATVELLIGREVVGTVDQVDDEGERSWAVTLIVLEEDLDR